MRFSSRGDVQHGEEGAALMMVLLSMLVASALSLLVLGTLLAQNVASAFDRKNVRAIHAAEAGVDVALARIRSSTSPDPLQGNALLGDRTKLPCALAGPVQGSPGGMRYDVEIRYYREDPADKGESWRGDAANRLACTETGTSALPRFALLTSNGLGDGVARLPGVAGDRQIETVYDLRLTNQNVTGGVIRNYQNGDSGTPQLCWDAGSPDPLAGTIVTIRTCSEQLPQQLFAWRGDFTIALAHTVVPGNEGLCVEVGDEIGGHSNTREAVLRPCNAAATQQFGFSNNARFLAKPAFGGRWCPTQQFHNAQDTALWITTNACVNSGAESAWQPSPQLGAGSVGNFAGPVAGVPLQWVNYAEFGRCFDVTQWDVTYVSMISWPCKQLPGESVGWNQTLEWDGVTKQLFTRAGSSGETFTSAWAADRDKYCVTAPITTGGYVKMTQCSAAQPNQEWTVNRELPGNYALSYTMVDHLGRCLGVGPRNTSAPNSGIWQWSSIVVDTCDASGQQKWSAPPNLTSSVLRDTREINR